MQKLILGVLLVLVASCGSDDVSRESLDASQLTEASTAFDLGNLEPFLHRVSNLVDSGFGEPEISELMTEVSAMAVDTERKWRYTVIHAGQSTPLEVHVFMDDFEAPDVAFFTSKVLAEAISRKMDSFMEELGN